MRERLAFGSLHTVDSPSSVFLVYVATHHHMCQHLSGPRGWAPRTLGRRGSRHKPEAHAAGCAVSDQTPGL